jgi:AbrB family looped-hinge helix DNA binding protein
MDKSAVVDERGRIVIPQSVRDLLGISAGTMMGVKVVEGGIFLTNEGNARERLLAAFREVDASLADRLIAERQTP